MTLADDGRVVGIARDARIQPLHRRLESLGKDQFLPAWQQHIVRGNAGLACIDQLAVGHLERHGFDIAILGNDARRFATQLQRRRRQVHGRGLCHAASHSRRTCKQQMVELQA